jgi:hypothetical protein
VHFPAAPSGASSTFPRERRSRDGKNADRDERIRQASRAGTAVALSALLHNGTAETGFPQERRSRDRDREPARATNQTRFAWRAGWAVPARPSSAQLAGTTRAVVL